MNWEMTGPLVAVLGPLVGVPLSAMTFYLRAIREAQAGQLAAMGRRIEGLEQQMRNLEGSIEAVARGYTTRGEWERESLLARQQLGRLAELVARLGAKMEEGAVRVVG